MATSDDCEACANHDPRDRRDHGHIPSRFYEKPVATTTLRTMAPSELLDQMGEELYVCAEVMGIGGYWRVYAESDGGVSPATFWVQDYPESGPYRALREWPNRPRDTWMVVADDWFVAWQAAVALATKKARDEIEYERRP